MEHLNSNEKSRKIREENKKKRRKLEKEYDITNWYESDNNELPPEIESFFLDNIMAYENGIKIAKRVTVYELMNSPSYKKISELRGEEVDAELKSISALLFKHQIVLDTICEVPKQELYRFITEELFFEEINDVRIPDLITHFTYEEFHPDHLFEIKYQSFVFLMFYFDQSSDMYKNCLSSEAAEQDWHLHFRNAFRSFEMNDYAVADTQYDLDLKEAHVNIECDVMAMPDGSRDYVYFKGKGMLHLVHQNDCWGVNSVELPAPQTGSLVSQ